MRKACIASIAIVSVAGVAEAQTPDSLNGPLPSSYLQSLYQFDDGGWRLKANVRVGVQVTQDQRLATLGPPPVKTAIGPQFNITQSLVGALQYHWTAGQKPELGLRGVPVRAKFKTNGVYFGFSYRP